jgi:hypothetical protein
VLALFELGRDEYFEIPIGAKLDPPSFLRITVEADSVAEVRGLKLRNLGANYVFELSGITATTRRRAGLISLRARSQTIVSVAATDFAPLIPIVSFM